MFLYFCSVNIKTNKMKTFFIIMGILFALLALAAQIKDPNYFNPMVFCVIASFVSYIISRDLSDRFLKQ